MAINTLDKYNDWKFQTEINIEIFLRSWYKHKSHVDLIIQRVTFKESYIYQSTYKPGYLSTIYVYSNTPPSWNWGAFSMITEQLQHIGKQNSKTNSGKANNNNNYNLKDLTQSTYQYTMLSTLSYMNNMETQRSTNGWYYNHVENIK